MAIYAQSTQATDPASSFTMAIAVYNREVTKACERARNMAETCDDVDDFRLVIGFNEALGVIVPKTGARMHSGLLHAVIDFGPEQDGHAYDCIAARILVCSYLLGVIMGAGVCACDRQC